MRLLLLIPFIALLTACASPYPLGMNEEQWNKLSAQERQQLFLEQQKYREQQRLERIKADARARELQHQEQMAEQRRLEALYNNPGNGNVLMVNILGGELHQGSRVKHIREATYQIARGEIKEIELQLENRKKHYYSTERAYLEYAMSGNAVYLYLDDPSYEHNKDKRISLLRDGKWACGSNYKKYLKGSYEKLKHVKFFVKETAGRCTSTRVIEMPQKRYR